MRNRILYTLVWFLMPFLFACKKDKPTTPLSHTVTSPEYEDKLLFVNQNDFQILTDKPAEFSSDDPLIQISSDGIIKRITSGEIVPINITWKDGSASPLKIYALGATDDNHDEPYASFHGNSATEAFNSYRQGWKTLQILPLINQSYGIILRHGDADDGKDFTIAHPDDYEPSDWWKSCDPMLARQLNARGKARSLELGKIFKELNYPIARVISSEFCRAVSTAELINSGPVIQKDERINHPDHNTTGKGLFQGMLDIMHEQPVDNKMTLLVLHHPVNETGSSGGQTSFPLISPFTWTGSSLVSISPDKTVTYQGAVSYAMFKYWRNLKLNK